MKVVSPLHQIKISHPNAHQILAFTKSSVDVELRTHTAS